MLRKPKSMEECSYLKRSPGMMIWVFKGEEIANIEYTCQNCGFSGEKQQKLIWEKKRINGKNLTVFSFTCDKCGKTIDVESNIKRRRK